METFNVYPPLERMSELSGKVASFKDSRNFKRFSKKLKIRAQF